MNLKRKRDEKLERDIQQYSPELLDKYNLDK